MCRYDNRAVHCGNFRIGLPKRNKLRANLSTGNNAINKTNRNIEAGGERKWRAGRAHKIR